MVSERVSRGVVSGLCWCRDCAALATSSSDLCQPRSAKSRCRKRLPFWQDTIALEALISLDSLRAAVAHGAALVGGGGAATAVKCAVCVQLSPACDLC